MIIVSLFGGLGNQMFQYAAAKALALKYGYKLKMDVSLLQDRTPKSGFTYRDYELNIFQIDDEIASVKEVKQFVPDLWHSPEYLKQFYKLKRLFTGKHLYREQAFFQYNTAFDKMPDNTFLYGYFQTEKYYLGQESILRKSFALKSKLDEENLRLITELEKENSISVHIRRGDYANSDFEMLTADMYYIPAIEQILSKIPDAKFYFFTNDLDWTRQTFNGLDIDKKFITHNSGSNSFKDMILMSHCKHNIIANSSFSWWGAWLNAHPEKTVIAPTNWYKSGRYVGKTGDLIPASWIRI